MENKNGYFGVYVVLGMIIFGSIGYYFTNKRNSDALNSSHAFTQGKVVDFSFSNYTYYIEYVYYVDGVKYKSSLGGMEKFYCEDGKLGCIGAYFEVKYATEDPSISEINLGRYNEYKPLIL